MAISLGGEYAVILMERSSETGSVLTKAAMDVLWELDAIVKIVEVNDAIGVGCLVEYQLSGRSVHCVHVFCVLHEATFRIEIGAPSLQ